MKHEIKSVLTVLFTSLEKNLGPKYIFSRKVQILYKRKYLGVQRLATENSSGARVHWVENKPI